MEWPQALVPPVEPQPAEARGQRPELLGVFDGPVVQLVGVPEGKARQAADFLQEAPHRAGLDAGAVGLPDR